jgi:2-polyprenyl-3-methyl-5-hydroxy-6-metoxy-1,4-benzoquinol methylase
MSFEALSERQVRERHYYDQYSAKVWSGLELNFDPIRGREERPWNSYWFYYSKVKELFKSPPQRLLDFGCGAGYGSVLFATVGYEVWGFDISPNNVALSAEYAERYGVHDRTHFKEGTAEKLEFESDFFDVVAGLDILHHVNIPDAIAECWRVLKPGGTAVFREPLRAPVFDRLRGSRFGRWLVPNEMSFDKHVTEDERKLDASDLAAIRRTFPQFTIHRFRLFSRVTKLLSNDERTLGKLERLDQRLLASAPLLGRFAGEGVLVLQKPGANSPR